MRNLSETVKTMKRSKRATAALALLTAALFGVATSDAASQTNDASGSRALAVVAKDAGKCGAILVGVDEYETLDPLEYASSDARKLRDALVEIGFPSETIRTFVSDGRIRERPSRDRILKALDETLAASGPDSTVLIALSGHGFETEDGDAAFCPEDVDAKNIDGKIIVSSETAILIEDVAERLKADDARFKMLIVDACREPASTEKSAATRTRSFSPIPDANGVAFLQSCESREFSWEHPELEGGVFTAFFAEGLRGAADADGDGGVSFLDVCNYATSQTQRFVRDKRDARQTPFYRFSGVVDFWLKEPTRTPDGGAKIDVEELYRQGRAWAFGLDGRKIDGERGCELLSQAAEAGALDARAELAELRLIGWGETLPNPELAVQEASEPADAGNPFAAAVLWTCYANGLGVVKNEKKAEEYLKVAFQGFQERAKTDVRAKYYLGECYLWGLGLDESVENVADVQDVANVENAEDAENVASAEEEMDPEYLKFLKDSENAEIGWRFIREAADEGCAQAVWRVWNDDPAAVEERDKWLRKAAEQDNALAMTAWGLRCRGLRNVVKKDSEGENDIPSRDDEYVFEGYVGGSPDAEEAAKQLRKAAELGDAKALAELGGYYYDMYCLNKEDGKTFEKAVACCEKGAELGSAEAMIMLAGIYFMDEGKRNEAKAEEWLLRAADVGAKYEACRAHFKRGQSKNDFLNNLFDGVEGVRMALLEFALTYYEAAEKGEAKLERELYKKSAKWFYRAAELGSPYATYAIGRCYERGLGVEADINRAVEYYRKAREMGDLAATHNLGALYCKGWKGTEPDYNEAAACFREICDAYAKYGGNDSYFPLFPWLENAPLKETAALALANFYERGRGVEKNLDEAARLYEIAATCAVESVKAKAEAGLKRLKRR